MLFHFFSAGGGEDRDVVGNPCDSCPCELPPTANSKGLDALMAAMVTFTAASVIFLAILFVYARNSYRYERRENAELLLLVEMKRRQLKELKKATAIVSTNTTTIANATPAATCSIAAAPEVAAGRVITTNTNNTTTLAAAAGTSFTPTTTPAGVGRSSATSAAAAGSSKAATTTSAAPGSSKAATSANPTDARRCNAATTAAPGCSLADTTATPTAAGRCNAGTPTVARSSTTTPPSHRKTKFHKFRNFVRELCRSATTRRSITTRLASAGRSTAATPTDADRLDAAKAIHVAATTTAIKSASFATDGKEPKKAKKNYGPYYQ
ncbi:uncharacterized protein LOC116955327 [Petromyzon marinus]|uniref:uncharacterized protein LOC116955327 n=1 Tax=Petromyzon marinus TaxID=7757 RepID=UPI003F71D9C5